jgi:hypothetical protein
VPHKMNKRIGQVEKLPTKIINIFQGN